MSLMLKTISTLATWNSHHPERKVFKVFELVEETRRRRTQGQLMQHWDDHSMQKREAYSWIWKSSGSIKRTLERCCILLCTSTQQENNMRTNLRQSQISRARTHTIWICRIPRCTLEHQNFAWVVACMSGCRREVKSQSVLSNCETPELGKLWK